jgi:hypothetical protein
MKSIRTKEGRGKSINTRKERNQLNMDGMEIDGTRKDANK